MKKIEYKTEKYEQGLTKRFSGDDFEEIFLLVLAEQGKVEWELRKIIRKKSLCPTSGAVQPLFQRLPAKRKFLATIMENRP